MDDSELLKIFHSHAEPRKHNFRNHRHSAFEIGLIIEGKGSYLVNGHNFDIHSGDIFIYHTNEPHCITDIDEDSVMHLINIQFEPRYLWIRPDICQYLQTIFHRSSRRENRITSENPLYEPIHRLILDSEREWDDNALGSAELIRSNIIRILILLTRAEGESARDMSMPAIDREKCLLISRSMDYICDNITSAITLDEIAGQTNLSRSYYCSEFKRLNGISPWDYINIKRVEKSMQILRNEDRKIIEIALMCGFNNTANFNRIFKNVTGLTPREYRLSNI